MSKKWSFKESSVMAAIHYKSATELARLIAAGEVGARELLEHFFSRIDRYGAALNAFVWFDREDGFKRYFRAPGADCRPHHRVRLAPPSASNRGPQGLLV